MNDYRLYSVDRAGKIVAGEWLNARSDEEAITIVRAMNGEIAYEIWNRTTFVAAIPGFNGSAQPVMELSVMAKRA